MLIVTSLYQINCVSIIYIIADHDNPTHGRRKAVTLGDMGESQRTTREYNRQTKYWEAKTLIMGSENVESPDVW